MHLLFLYVYNSIHDFYFLVQLGNRTALRAALKKNSIIFYYFAIDETNKKYELFFLKMTQSYKTNVIYES